MTVRSYQFIVGAETSTLPTTGTPTDPTDTVTLGYADVNYTQGYSSVADITALQAISAANRSNGDLVAVRSTNSVYVFDSASSETSDSLRIVTPSAGTGRWILGNYEILNQVLQPTAINYLEANPGAEISVNSWAAYADAAGANPVDMTGGSPNSTLTRSTSSPLRGLASFLWTKAGSANRQGEGFSFDFTIPSADVSKNMEVSFDVDATDASYVASEMKMCIYDVTGTALITPVSQNIAQSKTLFTTSFLATTSQSYRFGIHTAGTSTNNYAIKFDNFQIKPITATTGFNDPTTLSNAEASRLGYKTYSHGTNYNGGNAPTITLTAGGGTLSSITHSKFIPKQTQDGTWVLSGSFEAVVSSAARTTATFAINGVTFANDETFSFTTDVAQNLTAAVSTATTGGLVVEHQSATTVRYRINFRDFTLSSKSNWIY